MGLFHGLTLGSLGGFTLTFGSLLHLALLFHLLLAFTGLLLGLHFGLASALLLHFSFAFGGIFTRLHGLGLLLKLIGFLLPGGHGRLLLFFPGFDLGLFGGHFLLLPTKLHFS